MANKPSKFTPSQLKRKFGIRDVKIVLERMNIVEMNKHLARQAKEWISPENVDTLSHCRIILEKVNIKSTPKASTSASTSEKSIPQRLPWMPHKVPYTKNSFEFYPGRLNL